MSEVEELVPEPLPGEGAEPELPEEAEPLAAKVVEEEPEEAKEPAPTVPLDALHESRAQTAELRGELGGLRQQLQDLQGLKNELAEYRQSQQTVEEETAYENDPLGALKNSIEEVRTHQTQTQQANQQQAQARQQMDAFQSTVVNQVNTFIEEQPDYHEARSFMQEVRGNQLRVMGIPDHQIAAAVDQEEIQLAQRAYQTGANAADMVYRLAQTNGYKMAEPAPTPGDKLKTIEKGQKVAVTIGSGESAEVGLNDIAAMSESEFDEHWDKMSKEAEELH